MHLASFYDVTYFNSLTDASQAFSNQEHPLFYQARGTEKLTWLSCSISPLSPVSIFSGNLPRIVAKWEQRPDLHFSLPFAMFRSFSNYYPRHEAPAQAQTNTSSCTQGALAPRAWRYLWRWQKNPSPWRFIGYLIRFLPVYVYFHHMLTSVL